MKLFVRSDYRQRINKAGLCIDCHKPKGETGTKLLCRPCANRQADRVRKRKSAPPMCGYPGCTSTARIKWCEFHAYEKEQERRKKPFISAAYEEELGPEPDPDEVQLHEMAMALIAGRDPFR